MGNMGNAGLEGGSQVVPERFGLPLWAEVPQDLDSKNGVRTKAVGAPDTLLESALDWDAKWTARDWGAQWTAWRVLNEFATTHWRAIKLPDWQTLGEKDGKTRDDFIKEEISALKTMMQNERPDALGEIVAQDALYERFAIYFLRLLRISTSSHPKTCTILHAAGLVGLMAVMHFKENPGKDVPPRPRPSQLLPALLPPVPVPGHPAYPSGHATQSMLMALLLLEVLPEARRELWKPYLLTQAYRMGRNREIAGLHYRSDSTAGYQLAAELKNILMSLTSDGTFGDLLNRARDEWQ
jgi:hypothetical protein